MDAYAPIAEFYDSEHDEFADDIEWYVHLAGVAGPRMLEMGCGSGRLLAQLAAAGNQVVGVDSSVAMMERAGTRLHAAVARGEVRLVPGSMEDLPDTVSGPFDLVIVPLNGLLHVDAPEGQQHVLAEAARVLRSGGLLAIDVLHAIPDALTAFDGRVMHEGSWEIDGGVIAKFSSRTVDWTNQLIAAEVWYDALDGDGALSRHRTAFAMRWVSPAEIALMLTAAGFVDVNLAGGYDGSPLSDMSDRMLVVARKPDAR